MRVTVLGSGTLLPNACRASAAHHVQTERASVLLDCGSGTVHGLARHGIDWVRLTHVAITHEHADHVGDLSALMLAMRHAPDVPREEKLTLLGPRGFRSWVERAAGALGPHLTNPRRPFRIVEIDEGEPFEDTPRGIRLEARPTPHTDLSVAYRLTAKDGVVGYTGDTGPSAEVAAFLKGADVLICECGLTEPGERPGHLAPADVASLADVVRPAVVALTHVFPPQTPSAAADGVRAGYPGRVVAAFDGMVLQSSREGWTVDPDGGEV